MNGIDRFREALRFAGNALRGNRQRTFLTMLGVATGIFAITGILTMVNSLQTSITQGIASLGNTVLFVHHWPWAENNEDWYKFINRPKVSYEDYLMLRERLQRVDAVGYQVAVNNQTVQALGRSATGVEVDGITEQMSLIGDLELTEGRYFSGLEFQRGKAVAVIGHAIANNLFPNGSAVGQYIRVGKERLLVIGVLARKGKALMFGNSDDDKVFVPYPQMASMYDLRQRNVDHVISVRAVDHADVPWVEQEITGLMRLARGLGPRSENNFAINKQEALMNRFDSVFGYLRIGGVVISIFSVLIGGFSIGNIMYISVKERTTEIGVQKALGSTKGFILLQYVMESVLVCLLGGLMGIAVVFGIGALADLGLAAAQVGLRVSFSLSDLLTGLGLAVVIGLVAGVVPSVLAARLDPVEAIRG